MSSSLSFHIPKALPSLSPPYQCNNHQLLSISCQQKESHHNSYSKKQVAEPAFAVTGVNEGEDLVWVLIQSGISAFIYFIVFPPIIMHWLRTRWYKRNLLEMYLQFMFVFMFYPGVLLWAPFLNFRKFPRDPTMKYPWSTPENPSQIKGGFLKYPWAQPEDYE
ncbi:hypothetical protein DH2020_032051 [Rehmannia glutinosa]|uniref:NAD(P)H-quinone oxidoreductase subunit L, chloroplastic n=1 Tax=Rehmannia glutinosa TaxID=99300 RepID=A0ABR0VGC2_REHGL